MTDKIYAGIGSRETPADVLGTMTIAAAQLSEMGWLLRTGGAKGADSAFAKGTLNREIHVPWGGFNGVDTSKLPGVYVPADINPNVLHIAAAHHPNWDRLTQGAQKLMCRNVTIVLGRHLEAPAKMVICWTPDGAWVGGTSHAMRVARAFNIPIFNLAIESDIEQLQQFVHAQATS